MAAVDDDVRAMVMRAETHKWQHLKCERHKSKHVSRGVCHSNLRAKSSLPLSFVRLHSCKFQCKSLQQALMQGDGLSVSVQASAPMLDLAPSLSMAR